MTRFMIDVIEKEPQTYRVFVLTLYNKVFPDGAGIFLQFRIPIIDVHFSRVPKFHKIRSDDMDFYERIKKVSKKLDEDGFMPN